MLVEVLAALVVTVALVVVVLPFMGDLVRRWQEGQASIVRADGWMRAVSRLTDDVAEALPIRDPIAGPSLAFSMTPTRVELIRPVLGAAAPAGFEQVTYRVERGESGERLVRTTRPVLDGRGRGAGILQRHDDRGTLHLPLLRHGQGRRPDQPVAPVARHCRCGSTSRSPPRPVRAASPSARSPCRSSRGPTWPR